MVERLRPPRLLDPRPDGGDAGSGLAGMNGEPDRTLGQAQPALARHLRQMERVGWRADKHGGAERLHPREPRRRVLPATGNGQRPDRPRPPEAPPETDEEAEGEGEEEQVPGGDADAAQDERP